MKIILLALMASAIAFAADVNGKWSGTFSELKPDGTVQNNGSAYMTLKVDGTTVTGTAGPSESQQGEISNGRIAGNNITFDLRRGELLLKFEMTFEGGALKGTAKAERDSEKLTAKFDLKRKE